MRLRLTSALIASLTLTLAAASVLSPGATAAPIPVPQLRAELRHARHHLATARETLRAARRDLTGARTLAAAMETAALTDRDTAAPAGDGPADGLSGPTSTPSSAPASATTADDPAVLVALALLRPRLAEHLLADRIVTEDELATLAARVDKWRRIVRRARRAEHTLETRLERRLQIREWNRRGAWRPLIELAARRYGVSADGLFRLMTYESGGRRLAGSTYKGLFQYHPGTWAAGWNPWRSASIYDGWAQIRATAYAISRGMGPGHWPNTYPRAF